MEDWDDDGRDLWAEQSKLPLRQRDAMWWAGVALPNVLLAGFIVVMGAWIAGII